MQLNIKLRNVSATIANIKATEKRVIEAVKATAEKHGLRTLAKVQALCPVDTAFMVDHTRLVFTPQGFGFEVGWLAEDFTSEGLAFYPVFVIAGTSKMAAQDCLTPAFAEIRPEYTADLALALKAAV